MKHKKNMTGQLVAITGGSAGLGLSMAIEYVQRDAHVLIVARDPERLKTAVMMLEENRQSTTQCIYTASVDCRNASATSEALLRHGVPDVLITCAGRCLPRLFIDLEARDFVRQMSENYESALHAVIPVYRALLHKSARIGLAHRTRIVLVSSTAAFLGLAGYSAYAPSKAALRALADHLRQETLLYKSLRKSLRIHCVFPSTMTSPSFLNEEQKVKPQVTKVLENVDAGQSTGVVARKIMQSLQREEFLISTDFQGSLIKAAMMGSSPGAWRHAWKSMIGRVALKFYAPLVWDRQVRKFGDLQKKDQRHGDEEEDDDHSRSSSKTSHSLLNKEEYIFMLHEGPSIQDIDSKYAQIKREAARVELYS